MDGYYDRPWYAVLYPRPPPRQAQKEGFRADSPHIFTCAKPLLLAAWRKYGRRASTGRWWVHMPLWVQLPLRPFRLSYRLCRCLCNTGLRRILFLHWLAIHEPLTFPGPDRCSDTLAVVVGPRIPVELSFGNISVQVLLTDGMVRAIELALEQAKKALGGKMSRLSLRSS